MTADDWNRRSVLKSWAISRTNLWNGSFLRRSSVDFWYLLISRRATVPGRNLCGFLTPPLAGADFLAALVANCFRGALPPVDLRAVCLVLAIFSSESNGQIPRIIYHYAWAGVWHRLSGAISLALVSIEPFPGASQHWHDMTRHLLHFFCTRQGLPLWHLWFWSRSKIYKMKLFI